ncbi:MAG: (d)CMP kinase [Solirubrobacteraceae bacterium]
MVVAIDGPAGAGKSTVARAVAEELGFTYLDTGAMYRCVGLAAARRGVPAAVAAREARIVLGERVLLDGEDVTVAIRSPQASEAASRAAADPDVRSAMVARQREIVSTGDWVAEGRDIATAVAPDAAVKVFLTADPAERARRRAGQIGAEEAVVAAEQAARDRRDSTLGRSALEPAPGAVELDTTGLPLDAVVERVAALARAAR